MASVDDSTDPSDTEEKSVDDTTEQVVVGFSKTTNGFNI